MTRITSIISRTPLALLAFALVACAPGMSAPVGEPVAEPEQFAASLQRATTPEAPQQVNFAWTLDESGSRVRGSGVIRFQAPERLRLDLFGSRGETYLTAALVGGDFRLPGGVTEGIDLPSPALLWSALGVIRPPSDAPLTGATTSEDLAVLRYRLMDGASLEYQIATMGEAPPRLQQVERRNGRAALETLRLEYGSDGTLIRTRYRDWSAYRDLVFETESIREVSSFPESIWMPHGSSR